MVSIGSVEPFFLTLVESSSSIALLSPFSTEYFDLDALLGLVFLFTEALLLTTCGIIEIRVEKREDNLVICSNIECVGEPREEKN